MRSLASGIPGPSVDESRAVSEHMFLFLSARLPGAITTYKAMPAEVDVWSLVGRLPGWRWLLPRIEDDHSLTWRDAHVDLEVHRWGMEQPGPFGQSVPVHEIDVFLVPGLAFDRSGNRLGRGGGYYDRVLEHRRSDSLVIGVSSDARVLSAIPVEPHDRPMTHLATESGITATPPTI